MPTSNDNNFQIDIPLHNVGTSQLKRLLSETWLHVALRYKLDGESLGQWDRELADVTEAVMSTLVANDNFALNAVWKRTVFILHRLLDQGWEVYAGSDDGVLCIVLTNSLELLNNGYVETVQVPRDLSIPVNAARG